MSEKRKVVLAGGGITSLAAAYYLKKAGMEDFLILERYLQPGGLCRSVSKDGFVFDYTGHVLWRMDPETKKFYEDVLKENLFWQDRKAMVYTKGRMVPYPYQAHLGALPPDVTYECLKGFIERERHLKGVDFESWSRSMFGEGITEHFMRPFNEKLFGLPLKEMCWDWCQDVPVPSMEQILRGAILKETFAMKGNAQFAYPRQGGMQSLVDALVAYIGSDKFLTGRDICEVNLADKVVTHRDWAGNLNTVNYEHLISTIPLRKLLKIVKPQDGQLADFGKQLRANNVACVMIGFEKPISDLHWLYTPDRDIPFYRLTFPTSTCPALAPEGCGAVMAEITVPPDLTASVSDFVGSTLASLKHMGLWEGENANRVLVEHMEMIVPAYVIYDLVRKNVPKMKDGFKTMNVHLAGRFGAWWYTSVSDNIAEGRLCAKDILK